eukprot:1179845-Prorocentrum_minimum.AAC.1
MGVTATTVCTFCKKKRTLPWRAGGLRCKRYRAGQLGFGTLARHDVTFTRPQGQGRFLPDPSWGTLARTCSSRRKSAYAPTGTAPTNSSPAPASMHCSRCLYVRSSSSPTGTMSHMLPPSSLRLSGAHPRPGEPRPGEVPAEGAP